MDILAQKLKFLTVIKTCGTGTGIEKSMKQIMNPETEL